MMRSRGSWRSSNFARLAIPICTPQVTSEWSPDPSNRPPARQNTARGNDCRAIARCVARPLSHGHIERSFRASFDVMCGHPSKHVQTSPYGCTLRGRETRRVRNVWPLAVIDQLQHSKPMIRCKAEQVVHRALVSQMLLDPVCSHWGLTSNAHMRAKHCEFALRFQPVKNIQAAPLVCIL